MELKKCKLNTHIEILFEKTNTKRIKQTIKKFYNHLKQVIIELVNSPLGTPKVIPDLTINKAFKFVLAYHGLVWFGPMV